MRLISNSWRVKVLSIILLISATVISCSDNGSSDSSGSGGSTGGGIFTLDTRDDANARLAITDNNSVYVLKFYNLQRGVKSEVKTVTIVNNANTEETLYLGDDDSDFTIEPTSTCGKTIPANGSCTLDFSITLDEFESEFELFKVVIGNSFKDAIEITLIAYATNSARPNPEIVTAPDELYFVNVEAGVKSEVQTVTVRNIGNSVATLRFDERQMGSFTKESTSTCGATLGINESCTLDFSVLATDVALNKNCSNDRNVFCTEGEFQIRDNNFDDEDIEMIAFKKGADTVSDEFEMNLIRGVTTSKRFMLMNYGADFTITGFDKTSIGLFLLDEATSTCKNSVVLATGEFCLLDISLTPQAGRDEYNGRLGITRENLTNLSIELEAEID